MIRYYFVKVTATATDANKEHAGEVVTYIYGKGQELLFCDSKEPWLKRDCLSYYFVRDYGCKRECDARRNWCYKHPVNSECWTETTEIVSIDVQIAGCDFKNNKMSVKIHKNF